MSTIIHADDNSFASVVLQSTKPVLVDFFAEWCGPCKVMAPVMEQIALEKSNISVVKVDVDACPNVSSQYNISSIPTFMVFEKGEVVNTAVGAVGKAQLLKLVESY